MALSGAHALGRCHADRSGYVSAPPLCGSAIFCLCAWKGDQAPLFRAHARTPTLRHRTICERSLELRWGPTRADPWTFAPTTFSNQYFTLLRDEKWCGPYLCLRVPLLPLSGLLGVSVVACALWACSWPAFCFAYVFVYHSHKTLLQASASFWAACLGSTWHSRVLPIKSRQRLVTLSGS